MTSKKGSDLVPRAEPTAAETLAREIVALPTERLRQELAEVLRLTVANLVRLALIVKTLEERGEDLSDLRIGLLSFVRLIAYGRLAPEAVVAFAGRPLLLRALAGLPLDRQLALVVGEAVAVIDPADPAQVQRIALMNLPNAAIRLVFGEGELRSPEAQRLALRPRRPRREDDKAAYRYRPRYDPASGTVSVGRMTVRLADVLTALASSAGPDRPPASDCPDDYLTVKVRLTRAEHDHLQALCRRHELPDWEMIRKALRAFGLIGNHPESRGE